ncbi:MAG: hypothetical protein A2X35_00880 [Elusimicrobia bacterium GWA2_61_42]|nr:MAG: hypothetical protein A2X35_00880 [Elusimicrobia bacterium GWA2_61_42]OGR75232.1 MAG: hypothetical protein A2X38_04905 [Elusimicrobia bacterium GWC2_61_25]
MTVFLKLFALLILLSPGASAFECPQAAQPGAAAAEKAEDCPWAGAARLLGEKADKNENLEPVFAAHAPGVLRQLETDRASGVLGLWGESINYDELANGVIVHPGILSFIASRLGAAQPRGKIAHAGLEHTYGYLFSLLPTKFGFKRARWVRPDLEDGLGLRRGSAGPAPAEGTLLANITCLAGSIALKDDAAASAELSKVLPHCGASIRAYASRPVRRGRLTEETVLPGGRKIVLRTDFAPFLKAAGGNSHLLVYSVYDSARGRASLISAFPVNEGFVKNAISPAGLGAGKPVQTRYNAYVEGLTGAGKFKGLRSVSVIE